MESCMSVPSVICERQRKDKKKKKEDDDGRPLKLPSKIDKSQKKKQHTAAVQLLYLPGHILLSPSSQVRGNSETED